MGHDHQHTSAHTPISRLWWAFGLTTIFLMIEVIGGLITQSLALLSDAAHMFTDSMALGIALLAIHLAKRPADAKRSFGYHRFEILAAMFNALLLFAVAMYILYEAWQRIGQPQEIATTGMLIIAMAGLLINWISMRLLSAGQSESLNIKGAYLEVWADFLGSIAVIVGALLIKLTGWLWIDPLLAVAIGLWVLPRTWLLLKQSLNILLEGVPEGFDLAEIEAKLRTVPNVVGVHDLHVWALTSGKLNMTAHLVYQGETVDAILAQAQALLAQEYDLHHVTLQCESPENRCDSPQL
ncbi:MAG: cation diffusion facilitator family transporter [Pseudomonadota bacterium]|nr:cation diffusion facilitator family transporter [Pseudomonadota bacterium]